MTSLFSILFSINIFLLIIMKILHYFQFVTYPYVIFSKTNSENKNYFYIICKLKKTQNKINKIKKI